MKINFLLALWASTASLVDAQRGGGFLPSALPRNEVRPTNSSANEANRGGNGGGNGGGNNGGRRSSTTRTTTTRITTTTASRTTTVPLTTTVAPPVTSTAQTTTTVVPPVTTTTQIPSPSPSPPPSSTPPRFDTGVTRRYFLSVVNAEVAPDGFKRQAVTIDGKYPGTLVTGNIGDRFEITVQNNLNNAAFDLPTTIVRTFASHPLKLFAAPVSF